MKVKFGQIFLYLYIFYFLYAPMLGKSYSLLTSSYIVSSLVLLFVVLTRFNLVTGKIVYMLRNKRVFCYLAGIIVASLYYAFCVILSDKYYNGFEDLRIVQNGIVFIYMLHALIIVVLLKSKSYSFECALKLIFRIASIQGIICILMFLFPSLKNVANTIFTNYSGFRKGDYIMLTRIYGLSCDYTYGMPIIHGAMSAICFYFALERERKYFWCFPFLFTVAALNSRTGLLVGLLGIFFAIVYYFKRHKLSKGVARLFVAIIVMFIIMLIALYSNRYTYQFLLALFQEIYEFVFHGNKTGTTEYLLESHLYFPDGLGFLFGKGHRVYGMAAVQTGNIASDIGFVNDMFMGGLIYCGILYGAIMSFVLKRTHNTMIRFIQYIVAVSWIIANIKGQVTVNYSFSVFMILFIVLITFLKDEEKGASKKKGIFYETE